MTKKDAMFWSGETLRERLAPLIEPFAAERVDCAAYTLAVGPEIYVSPNDQTSDPTTVTVRKLALGDAFTIPPASSPSYSPRKLLRSRPTRSPSFRSEPKLNSAAWSTSRVSTSIPAIAAN
jgi:hypothetical protein